MQRPSHIALQRALFCRHLHHLLLHRQTFAPVSEAPKNCSSQSCASQALKSHVCVCECVCVCVCFVTSFKIPCLPRWQNALLSPHAITSPLRGVYKDSVVCEDSAQCACIVLCVCVNSVVCKDSAQCAFIVLCVCVNSVVCE